MRLATTNSIIVESIYELYCYLRNESNGPETFIPTSYSSSFRKYVFSTTSRQVCSKGFAVFGFGMFSKLKR